MLDYGKGMFIASVVSAGVGVISAVFGIAQAVDSIKNSDKRAAITGYECGRSYAYTKHALENPEERDEEAEVEERKRIQICW